MLPRALLARMAAHAPGSARTLANVGGQRTSLCDVVIVAAVRTPFGGFLGPLATLTAPQLGAAAIRAAVAASGLTPADVDECYMGHVLGAGVGQAPARQAALLAGLPATVDCTTINKVCASGMKAVAVAAAAVAGGGADVVVAGGMESMSNAPHLVRGLRGGVRLGAAPPLEDALLADGLTCAVGGGHMGALADAAAAETGATRAALDALALASHARAAAAAAGARDGGREHGAEVVPVEAPAPARGAPPVVVVDDGARARLDAAKMPHLRPAFGRAGDPAATTTAGNASPLSDGAAALVLASSSAAALFSCRVLAHIVATADVAVEPARYPFAPAAAARKALERAGLAVADVDLWEVNEAFAAVTHAFTVDLRLDPATVNVAGGAVALGHPLGASGAAVVGRLAHEMAARGARVGVAAICNGGGGASAVVLRRSAPET